MLSEIATPNIIRMLAAGGFEYVIVDCEHGYFDYSQIGALVGIANSISMPIIIRVPSFSREVITKYMDLGANGLLFPMTESVDDIKNAVQWAKYAPMGKRGISTQRAHTSYCPPPLKEYLKQANEDTIIFAQIETAKGVSAAADIAKVDGVDALIVGPNDLASDLGTPGDFYTNDVQKSINNVIESAKSAGKPTGIIASNTTFLKECRANGMNILSCNSEIGMIISASKSIVGSMSE